MGKAIREMNKTIIEWDGEHDIDLSAGLTCCALAEIGGIQIVNDPFTVLVNLAVQEEEGGCAVRPFVLFTSTNNHLAGDELMDFIHKEKLGTVTFSKGVKNWADTGNTVYLYTWIVDKKAWNQYAEKILNELEN